jgi:hypothetical protein
LAKEEDDGNGTDIALPVNSAAANSANAKARTLRRITNDMLRFMQGILS